MANNNDGLSDKVKGGVNKAKGEVKDQVGNATNNSKMQREGKKEKTKGNVQKEIGKVKDL
ncbi:CsbD family protein [Alkalihalophilus marmarensis]|uniref:CsbD family protein n=1 Tax=Alkalihalophilus marmarensis TaxID=521377 RepID=UPI00204133AA|nr:CsbD family protein [Alkalihalophilus marmarensis]MCM3491026.1 CsbD family protein [Alkalihalophilus marmarensis]